MRMIAKSANGFLFRKNRVRPGRWHPVEVVHLSRTTADQATALHRVQELERATALITVRVRAQVVSYTHLDVYKRQAPMFLEKLLEIEVPEIFDGLIVVKKIVRDPGERAKVAVESYDDRIDPVGACVGMKGSRIHGIVRELKNENIDVINWTANTQLLIQRSLTPAKITSIDMDTEKMLSLIHI